MKLNISINRKSAYLILSLAALFLLPLLYSFGFVADDHYLIYSSIKNHFPINSDWTEYNNHYFRPLIILSFYINYLFSGSNPFFYYIFNLVIHLLNSFIIYNIFLQLEPQENVTQNHNLIFSISFLFFVLPQNLQNVFWISGRTDLLSSLFVFISVFNIIKYFNTNRKHFLFTSLIAQIFAFMSKESALVIIFYLLFFLFYRKNWLKTFIKKWPYSILFFLPSIFYFLYRFTIFTNSPLSVALNSNISVREISRFYFKSIMTLFIPFDITDNLYLKKICQAALTGEYLMFLVIILIIFYILFINRKSAAPKRFILMFFITLVSQVFYIKISPEMRLIYPFSLFVLVCLFITLKMLTKNRILTILLATIYLIFLIYGDTLLINRTITINTFYKKVYSALPEKIDDTKLYYLVAPLGILGQSWAFPETALMAQLKAYHNFDRVPKNFINAGSYNGYSLSNPLRDLTIVANNKWSFNLKVNNIFDYIVPYPAGKYFPPSGEYIFPKMRFKLLTERDQGTASSCEMILEDPPNSEVIIVR